MELDLLGERHDRAREEQRSGRDIIRTALPKAYEPQAVEGKWYRFWEEGGYFKPRPNPTRKPFVISMPPPNVTGALHLGHAITSTVEDILVRYHRMKGDETLWVPGEDHAGIATQTVVERLLAQEGTDRHKVGREAFLERVWAWVDNIKAVFRINIAAWVLHVTGRVNALRWMMDYQSQCAKFSYVSMKRV